MTLAQMNKVQFLGVDDGLHPDDVSSYNGGMGGSVSRRSIYSTSYAHSPIMQPPIEEQNGHGVLLPPGRGSVSKNKTVSFHTNGLLPKVTTYLESEEDRSRLFKALRFYHESQDVKKLVKNLKRILSSEKSHPLFKEIKPLLTVEHVAIYEKLTEPNKNGERLLKITKKRGEESYGFSLRGGKEHGLGFFVTAVADGSPAYLTGLKAGDEIRKVNGLPLQETLHEEFLAILNQNASLTLTVKNVGTIPCKNHDGEIMWNKIDNEEDSDVIANNETEDLSRTDRLVSFVVGKEGIGIIIQKKVENHEGVYIISVAENSVAAEVHLKVGDQILDVNGKSFRDISHSQAVDALRGKSRITMIVRYNEDVYNILSGPKEIKSILITEPKQEDNGESKKKPKKAKFTNKKNFELIEYDDVEPEYEVDNEDFIVPSASNFEYPAEILRGREVHFVPVPKIASLDIDLLRRDGYISVIAVHQGGAVQRHGFIEPGDWIMNVEGDDLYGLPLKTAKEIISAAMKRWSKYIEFIIACPPGRTPIDLPTKQETVQVLKDPQFTLKSTVSNNSFKDNFDGVKGAISAFNGNPVVKRDMSKRKDSLAMTRPKFNQPSSNHHTNNNNNHNNNNEEEYEEEEKESTKTNSWQDRQQFFNGGNNSLLSSKPTSPIKSNGSSPVKSPVKSNGVSFANNGQTYSQNANYTSSQKSHNSTSNGSYGSSNGYSKPNSFKNPSGSSFMGVNNTKNNNDRPPSNRPPSSRPPPKSSPNGNATEENSSSPSRQPFILKSQNAPPPPARTSVASSSQRFESQQNSNLTNIRNGLPNEVVMKAKERNERNFTPKRPETLQLNRNNTDNTVETSPQNNGVPERAEVEEAQQDAENSLSVSAARDMFRKLSPTTETAPESKPKPGKLSRSIFGESTQSSAQTSEKPKVGKISKSFFEEKQKGNENEKIPPVKSEKKVSKWGKVQTTSSAKNSPSTPQPPPQSVPSVVSSPVESTLDSTRSTSSQESVLDYTLNLDSSTNQDSSKADLNVSSPVKEESQSISNEEEMPQGRDRVSSFRDMFQKKNEDEAPMLKPKDEEIDALNTSVSSVRSMFQDNSKDKEISFKKPPSRLSGVGDDMFFQKGRAKGKSPRLSSTRGLFFEPEKVPEISKQDDQEITEISTNQETVSPQEEKPKGGESDDENKRPRTPQDIWEASQEEFDNKQSDGESKNTEEENFDDAASRTHMLLMKQASTSGEMPAQVQMAQILGDKNQLKRLPSFSSEHGSPRSARSNTSTPRTTKTTEHESPSHAKRNTSAPRINKAKRIYTEFIVLHLQFTMFDLILIIVFQDEEEGVNHRPESTIYRPESPVKEDVKPVKGSVSNAKRLFENSSILSEERTPSPSFQNIKLKKVPQNKIDAEINYENKVENKNEDQNENTDIKPTEKSDVKSNGDNMVAPERKEKPTQTKVKEFASPDSWISTSPKSKAGFLFEDDNMKLIFDNGDKSNIENSPVDEKLNSIEPVTNGESLPSTPKKEYVVEVPHSNDEKDRVSKTAVSERIRTPKPTASQNTDNRPPFQDFEFKRTVSEPVKRTFHTENKEISDFKFKRTVSDVPKRSEANTTDKNTSENNLIPSKMNSTKGSFKQQGPVYTPSQSEQIREFVKGIDFSSLEEPSPKLEKGKSKKQNPDEVYKPITVSELRAPFQSKNNDNLVPMVIETQKQTHVKPAFYQPINNNVSKPVTTQDIKKVINEPPPPLSLETVESSTPVIISPSGKPIKSILSKNKKNTPKKRSVQFSNFVDVGIAALPPTHEETRPQKPPPIPPKDPIAQTEANNNNRDINNIVDQINKSSDHFASNYTSKPISNGVTPTAQHKGAPKTGLNRREQLAQAKQKFRTSSKELTSKLSLDKNEDLVNGSAHEVLDTRPKSGASWFSDRSEDTSDGNKSKQFNSIPAY
ncbi:uncharacterized protein [Clytia hemisphaerica]|uniref:uncharacterized protein isoform X2 n=1 Tax=Clytia hemisphaerica TaxID=252671 RepID=UPI0034D61D25